ncbi:hypothetical protein AB0M46_04695 [Dactylosporangium sp. NPDC051485]|uniref:hypothetical protein n=1 Tax=Dactylosporangium sp. NPDC051485 TaxID=3154846 RepID=UPI00344436E9
MGSLGYGRVTAWAAILAVPDDLLWIRRLATAAATTLAASSPAVDWQRLAARRGLLSAWHRNGDADLVTEASEPVVSRGDANLLNWLLTDQGAGCVDFEYAGYSCITDVDPNGGLHWDSDKAADVAGAVGAGVVTAGVIIACIIVCLFNPSFA